MSTKQNLHIHTTYADGKDAPEEIVLAAIEKGFDSIGFSEHTYTQFSDYPYQMTVPRQACYQQEVLALKEKYKNQIEIFCGLEYEMFSTVPTDGFDYLIGSVHYIDIDGKKYGFDLRVTGMPSLFYLRLADDPSLMLHQEWIAECVKRGVFFTTHHNHFINYALSDADIAETIAVADEAFSVVRERHPL